MQNFKSFLLKEDNQNILPTGIFSFEFSETKGQEYSIKKNISNNIKKIFGENNIIKLEIDFDEQNSMTYIQMTYYFEHHILSTRSNFNIFLKEKYDELNDVFRMETEYDSFAYLQIRCEENINYKIDVPNVVLYCSNNTQFRDIGKYVSCKSLKLYKCDHLKCGILGLLQIKELRDLWDYNISEIEPLYKAFNILRDHIHTKDILECQEELITNGLRQYAKL